MTDKTTTTGGAVIGEFAQLGVTAEAIAEHLHLDQSSIGKISRMAVAAAPIRKEGDASFIVVPDDYQVKDITAAIEAAAANPRRKAGIVHLADVSSFATYVSQQGDVDSTYIYANPDSRTLTAVLNDHEIGESSDGDSLAGRRDFRAVYQAEYSREFINWLEHSGKQMDQETFAVFLEDNIADIAPPAEGSGEPSGDTLLAVALTLQAKTEVASSRTSASTTAPASCTTAKKCALPPAATARWRSRAALPSVCGCSRTARASRSMLA